MRRKFSAIGALACGALWLVACSDEDQIFDDRGVGGSGGRGGSGGNAGSGGSAGSAGAAGSAAGSAGSGNGGSSGADGQGGTAGTAGVGGSAGTGGTAGTAGTGGTGGSVGDPDGGTPDGGEADGGLACVFDGGAAGCDDGDECTTDTCSASGVCQASIAAQAPCATGFCTAAGACDCAVDRPAVAALPYDAQWQLVGEDLGGSSRDFFPSCSICASIPDEVIVFTATTAGTYRFGASGIDGTDPQIVVLEGNCTTAATVIECNDDISVGNNNARVDLVLTAGQVVTVAASPSCETEGGAGRITIDLL